MKKIILLICLFSLITNAQIKLELIKTLNVENSTDQLINVLALGDINKDGYDDFALQYYVNSDSSYAKIYFGGNPSDSTKAVLFTNPKSRFIFKDIYGGGDLNGDGINDFVVTYNDLTAIHNPPQYELQVHFGGKTISTQPDYSIICSALHSCMINGDYNGDGYDDIEVTRIFDNGFVSIFIFFGGNSLNPTPNSMLRKLEYPALSKHKTTMLGDVNNDGYDDFIVSANTDAYPYPKAAILFLGGNNLGVDNSIQFIGSQIYGRWQSALGDINGDGYSDFFIWGINNDLFLGGKQIDPNKPFYRSNNWLFNGIGDINKDGFDDYIKFLNSYAEIHLGSSQLDTIPDYIVSCAGDKVVNFGDINGDGRIELAFYISQKVNIWSVLTETSIDESEQYPTEYHLSQNYPNPFNPETTISYTIPKSGFVTLKVYDLLGREVATLVDGFKNAGTFKSQFTISNSNLTSGIYFYRLSTPTFSTTKKMTLVK